MTFRTFVRPLFVALSLAFAASSAAPAFAQDAGAKPVAAAQQGKDKSHKHEKAQFPMTAEKFTKIVNKRLEHAKAKMEEGLKKHSVSDAEKAKVEKAFDDGAALVRAAAKKAGSDGEVTKAEAQEVESLAKTLRKEIHAKLAAYHKQGKGKKAGKTV
jgi:Skp family chaperone for outer membrane proteins